MYKIALIVLSALLTSLSFINPSFSVLVWFSLVCLLEVFSQTRSLVRGSILAFIFGILFNGFALFWVAHVSGLGFIALAVYLSFYSILFFIVVRVFICGPYLVVVLPSIWVLIEYIKENVWCGFGWLNLGYSQYLNLNVIQLADSFGTKAISFAIMMSNVVVWLLIFRRKNYVRSLIGFVLVLIFLCVYSHCQFLNLKPQARVKVSVIQPNTQEANKYDDEKSPLIIEQLARLAQRVPKDSLVVFPEAAWPFTVTEDNSFMLQHFIADIDAHVLIGAVKLETGDFFNSALYFGPHARLLGTYRKIRIVPFGEYVPMRKVFTFVEALNSLGDMSRGKEYSSFDYHGKKFSTLICFEDASPWFVSRFAGRSDFLVNITNDEWFRGEPQAHQHLAILVFRAIENRRSFIRCANTGASGWISFTGEQELMSSEDKNIFVEGAATFNLTMNAKKTLYNKWGDFGIIFLCIVFVGLPVFKKVASIKKQD